MSDSKRPKSSIDSTISEVSGRKRKLKPHAVQYLQPKSAKDEPGPNDEDDDGDEDYVNKSNQDPDDNDEDDFIEEEFKLKCKNNLKISQKIKKNLLKQQKEQELQQSGSASSITPSAIGSSSKQSKSNQNKKFKKGFATTKQRLGKLLKLNRCVNI